MPVDERETALALSRILPQFAAICVLFIVHVTAGHSCQEILSHSIFVIRELLLFDRVSFCLSQPFRLGVLDSGDRGDPTVRDHEGYRQKSCAPHGPAKLEIGFARLYETLIVWSAMRVTLCKPSQ